MTLPSIEDLGGTVRWVTAEDGAKLRTASFPAKLTGRGKARTVAKGRILFLTGFSEFIEKHLETIGELQGRGFQVFTLDWRGQGLSTRMLSNRSKGHVDEFGRFMEDLEVVLRETVPPGPITLMGHSMGGHLALRLAQERPARIARAVLVAPMIDILLPPFVHSLARMAALGMSWVGLNDHYAPGAQDYGPWREEFAGNILTSDRARFDQAGAYVRANPDLGIGGPTIGWVRAAFSSIDETRAAGYAEGILAPILIVGAGRDQLVDTSALAPLAHRLPRVRLVMIEDAMHEILKERDEIRARFWEAFDTFIEDTGRDVSAIPETQGQEPDVSGTETAQGESVDGRAAEA